MDLKQESRVFRAQNEHELRVQRKRLELQFSRKFYEVKRGSPRHTSTGAKQAKPSIVGACGKERASAGDISTPQGEAALWPRNVACRFLDCVPSLGRPVAAGPRRPCVDKPPAPDHPDRPVCRLVRILVLGPTELNFTHGPATAKVVRILDWFYHTIASSPITGSYSGAAPRYSYSSLGASSSERWSTSESAPL